MSPCPDKGKEDHEDGPPLLDQDNAATRALLDRIDVLTPVPFSNITSSLESIEYFSNIRLLYHKHS